MSFVVAQVSDTHLGGVGRPFQANYDAVVAAMPAIAPDLIIGSGDLSFDGADSDADMTYAAAQIARLGPVWAVPGNHDVGDGRAPRQPVTDARLTRWRAAFGPDTWTIDRDGWRILGLDSQLVGAHPDEATQAATIRDALTTLGDRRLAVFLHKPLWVPDGAAAYWTAPVASLTPLLTHPALRLIASGHLHLRHTVPPITQWAPAVSFVVAPADQIALPGQRACGILLHHFGADRVETQMVTPPGMTHPNLNEYGPLYPAAT